MTLKGKRDPVEVRQAIRDEAVHVLRGERPAP